jgi:predicted SAM-dependent methyltransferase
MGAPVEIKLNIGGGVNHPNDKMKDWTVVDIAGEYDVICNIATTALPFETGTVSYIFTSNTLEHIRYKQVDFVFNQFYRVLKPEGVVRICVPDLWQLCKAYIENDIEYWKQCKDPLNRLSEPPGHRVAVWLYQHAEKETGHHNAFDFETLQWYLKTAGFENIYQEKPGESKYEELTHPGLDRKMFGQLIVEAVK